MTPNQKLSGNQYRTSIAEQRVMLEDLPVKPVANNKAPLMSVITETN